MAEQAEASPPQRRRLERDLPVYDLAVRDLAKAGHGHGIVDGAIQPLAASSS